MLSRRPIRHKLLFGVTMLFLIVAVLSFSGFRGVYSYRELARTISRRASELPLSAELTRSVAELRYTFKRAQTTEEFSLDGKYEPLVREELRLKLSAVKDALRSYRGQLDRTEPGDPRIGDKQRERATVAEIEESLVRIDEMNRDEDWILGRLPIDDLSEELDELNRLSGELPGYLQKRMQAFAGEVRVQYRTWIVLTWITSILSGVTLIWLAQLFYRWVFKPLGVLIDGSRRVAKNDEFDHRIQFTSHDEMAELADAMNAMTGRFQEVRDELDQEVKLRTGEAIRNEQLASVGSLAAVVAHEINNPLGAIAWCAESLESRMHDILHADDEKPDGEQDEELAVLRNYLKKIQDEAFRCKGITDSLLDYSRMGDVEKHNTDLRELTQGVIDMLQHLGKNREKRIEFECHETVISPVNPQQLKQVVMNLVTNALDSMDAGGTVSVQLRCVDGAAQLIVSDDGCGMSEEVLEHLFERFFTRRRDGQGTGLGLSITSQIVDDHGGTIEATSAGPGCGSQFCVTLPLVQQEEKHEKEHQAA